MRLSWDDEYHQLDYIYDNPDPVTPYEIWDCQLPAAPNGLVKEVSSDNFDRYKSHIRVPNNRKNTKCGESHWVLTNELHDWFVENNIQPEIVSRPHTILVIPRHDVSKMKRARFVRYTIRLKTLEDFIRFKLTWM